MGNKKDTTKKNKERLLEALEKKLGNVTQACKACKLSRTTYRNYLNNDVGFNDAVEELKEVRLDFLESQFFKNVNAGKEISILFGLKCLGKERGYIERTEVINKVSGDLTVTEEIDLSKLDKETLMKILNAIDTK